MRLISIFSKFLENVFCIQPKLTQTHFCQTSSNKVFLLVLVSLEQIGPHLLIISKSFFFFGIAHEYCLKRSKLRAIISS